MYKNRTYNINSITKQVASIIFDSKVIRRIFHITRKKLFFSTRQILNMEEKLLVRLGELTKITNHLVDFNIDTRLLPMHRLNDFIYIHSIINKIINKLCSENITFRII